MAYNSRYTGAQIDKNIKKADCLFPIGYIYISINNTNPSTYFGGTWAQIQNTFLLAAGSSYTAGNTGGSSAYTPSGTIDGHTLTTTEIPSHNHVTTTVSGALLKWDGGSAFGYPSNCSSYGSSGCNNTWSLTTGSTGGGGSHNHGFTGNAQDMMPPYLVVYIWKRTA